MAWQLLYTSAPRLLEAGRSGFGTVARHRQISPLLASAIERASQFARLQGLDAGRVIYCHRIVAVAGGRFHVLSCIRDAGADYTGRTNHLAHHVIAEPREVAALGTRGPSPADVLLGMAWAGAWEEAPRFLEAADEIALAKFTNQSAGPWAGVTGDARHAWLLAAGEASRGAYLLHAPGADLRALFAESLRLAPERLWQIPFTTALQPSDEISDFRWIGVEADSTLRAQAESSGRPVLDLTRPATLPAPEVPANAAIIGLPRPTAAGAGAVEIAPPPRAKPPRSLLKAPAQTRAIPARVTRPWLLAGAAALLVIAAVPSLILPRMGQSREARARQEALQKRAADWHVFSPQTVASFLQVKPEKIASAEQMLDEMGKGIAALQTPSFDRMRDVKSGGELAQMGEAFGIAVPPEFITFAEGIRGLHALHTQIEKARATPEQAGWEACRTLRDPLEKFAQEQEDRAAFSKALDELRATRQRAEADALLACLHPTGNLAPAVSRAWVRERADAATPAVREILGAWEFVEEAPVDRVSDELKDRLAKVRDTWPKWLVQKAEDKLGRARSGSGPAEPAAHTEPRRISATPIYFVLGRASLENFVIPELRAGLFFRLLKKPGEKPVDLIERNKTGALCRTKVADKDFQLDLTTQKILPQPALHDVSEPFALIAHDGAGSDVVQLWVVPGGREPLFPKRTSGLRRNGERLEIEAAAIPLEGVPKSALWLRVPGEPAEPLPVNAWAVDLAGVRRRAEELRKKWEAMANADAPKAADAEFNALAEKIDTILHLDEPQSAQERLDLAPKEAPLFVRCGGYVMAVARAPRFPGFDKLFEAGKVLKDLGAKASAARVSEAIRPIGSTIQIIRGNFKNETDRVAYSPGLDALSKMLIATQPELPQAKAQAAQREKDAAAVKARLSEMSALLGDRLPAGLYELGTKVDGTDITLLQFEMRGR